MQSTNRRNNEWTPSGKYLLLCVFFGLASVTNHPMLWIITACIMFW